MKRINVLSIDNGVGLGRSTALFAAAVSASGVAVEVNGIGSHPTGERYAANVFFFHLAGRSLQKGTEVIIELWERHPEWPPLTLIQHPETPAKIQAQQVRYLDAYLEDSVLQHYQNAYGLHLCPSEAEGFGHYIVEAMSCGNLVITTDGPPMNEIVTVERGVLVDYNGTRPQRLGTNFYIDPAALAQAIERVWGLEEVRKVRLGQRARAWYQENDRYFKRAVAGFASHV